LSPQPAISRLKSNAFHGINEVWGDMCEISEQLSQYHYCLDCGTLPACQATSCHISEDIHLSLNILVPMKYAIMNLDA